MSNEETAGRHARNLRNQAGHWEAHADDWRVDNHSMCESYAKELNAAADRLESLTRRVAELEAAADDAINGLHDGLLGGDEEYARLSVAYAKSIQDRLRAALTASEEQVK